MKLKLRENYLYTVMLWIAAIAATAWLAEGGKNTSTLALVLFILGVGSIIQISKK